MDKCNYRIRSTGIFEIYKDNDTSKIDLIDEAFNNYYYRFYTLRVIFTHCEDSVVNTDPHTNIDL